MEKRGDRFRWAVARPTSRDQRLIEVGSIAVPLRDIRFAPALEVLLPVTAQEDLPFDSDEDINRAEIPIADY